MIVMAVTSGFLERSQACSPGGNSRLILKAHDLGVGVIWPSEEVTILFTKI